MATMATAYRPNPFDKLPIETNQHIASFLEYDTDICKFRSICQSTHDAVDADNCTFWRRRFVDHFENPGCWKDNTQFREAYQHRKVVLKNGAKFVSGDTEREKDCLEVLRDLVVQSFSGKPKGHNDNKQIYESANLQHIKRFLLANNIVQMIFEPPKKFPIRFTGRRGAQPTSDYETSPTPLTVLLQTFQVICAPMLLSFEPHLEVHHYGFPDSQIAVYSTAKKFPIFHGASGLDINMPFLMHSLNFWKYHMLREAEGTLYWAFVDLERDERPRWWTEQPAQGVQKKLGKHWKGSYAFVNHGREITAVRNGRADRDQIQDKFAGEESNCAFQDLGLEVDTSPAAILKWPEAFEHHLHSVTPPSSRAKTRAQSSRATPDAIADFKSLSFRFDGEGGDKMEQFLSAGWLNPLPPQEGFPGWQRMTMMKYFEGDDDEIDLSYLRAYEGVVLPGGQIIIGRWWSLVESDGEGRDPYSGPFIMWCVDGAKHGTSDEDDKGHAMDEAD